MQPTYQAHMSAPPTAAAGVSVNGLRPSCVFRAERGVRWANLSPSFPTHKTTVLGFPGASVVRNRPADAGDKVSIPV